MMFSWFERRLNPFPAEEPTQPPRSFFAFCWHFTRGATPYIAMTAVLMACIAIAEVWLFGFFRANRRLVGPTKPGDLL